VDVSVNPGLWRMYVYSKVGTAFQYNFKWSSSASAWTKRLTSTTVTPAQTANRWTQVITKLADWSATGGEVWTNLMQRLQIVPYVGATNDKASLDSVRVGFTGQPAIAFHFADGYDNFYSLALPEFQSRKLRCSVGLSTKQIDGAGMLTWAQAHEAENTGLVAVVNHGCTTAGFGGSKTQAQCRTEMNTAYDDLTDNGFTRGRAIVTYHNVGSNLANALAAAEQSDDGYPAYLGGVMGTTPDYEAMPFADPQYMKMGISGQPATSLADATDFADGIIARQCLGIMTIHNIVEADPDANEWELSKLQGVLDYIVSKKLPTVNFYDLYDLQTGPVSIPRPVGWPS